MTVFRYQTGDLERVWSYNYKDHGRDYASVYEREHAPGFRWYFESLGRTSSGSPADMLSLKELKALIGTKR